MIRANSAQEFDIKGPRPRMSDPEFYAPVASFGGVDDTTVNNDGVGMASYPAPEAGTP